MRQTLLIGCAMISMLLSGCMGSAAPRSTASASNRPAALTAAAEADRSPEWEISLDNIEACSCPTFCQCYFNDRPALHEAGKQGHEHLMRFCRFNNAFHVEKGHYGEASLDGLKFWMAGDLGGNFSTGQMDWAILHFEPAATPGQREALKAIIKAVFPVKWNSFAVGPDARIDWQKTDEEAKASLDGGKIAEIVLKQTRGSDNQPVVLQNVKFWAAPRNNGFAIMTNEIEAYRAGDRAFEFHQTNGFFTRIEMRSTDVAGPHAFANPKASVACATGECCQAH